MHNSDIIFQPIFINQLKLSNRIIMGSMHLGLEKEIDVVPRMIEFYQTRMEGKVSLITTGGISVNLVGKGTKHFFSFQNEEDCTKLHKIASSLSDKGNLCAQLFHAGRYAYLRDAVAPSAIRAPINRFTPQELSIDEIWTTISNFGQSAKIAKQLGFKAVEIMGSEGYLINQFLSPVTNHRTDEFGGSAQNRMKFGLEVLKAVRQSVGIDFPVIYRMSGIDLIPNSTTIEETLEFALQLKLTGSDALNIGIGWHESRVPTISTLVPRGVWSDLAGTFKKEISDIPIIVSNRINTPEKIIEILSNNQADIVSMARPFLSDPNFIQKIKDHQTDSINTCIACNQACLDHTFRGEIVSCTVNPDINLQLSKQKTNLKKKSKIVIVGAGPGGMEVARCLAGLADVILFDSNSRIGGQLYLASKLPSKQEFLETIRYYEIFFQKNPVQVCLNTICTIKKLEEIDPDLVIFATGVVPRKVNITGIETIHHGNYVEYLTNQFAPKKDVIIIGGGGIACDIAHALVEDHQISVQDYYHKYNINSYNQPRIQSTQSSRKVQIFRRFGKIGSGLGMTTGWALLQELENYGVEMYSSLQYKQITKDGLEVVFKSGEVRLFPTDSIILCAGQESNNQLALEYKNKYPQKQVYLIGGASSSIGLDAKRAFSDGLTLAQKIYTS